MQEDLSYDKSQKPLFTLFFQDFLVKLLTSDCINLQKKNKKKNVICRMKFLIPDNVCHQKNILFLKFEIYMKKIS